MRLIRAVLQPVNIRWYSVCASSGTSLIPKKARVRVPKDVRKSMVENFVNRFRKANAGKFPTVSAAKKDVGGSYYVIREILQELIYNSKMSPPVDTKTASSEKSAIKKDEIWTTNTEKDSQATEMEEELIIISPISKVSVQDSSSKIFESNQHPQPSISVASDDESKEVGKQSYHPTDEPRSKLFLDPENDKTAHEDEQKSNDKTAHENEQKSTEMEEELIIISPISKVAVQDSSSEIFESNQHPQPSISVESDDESKEVGKQCYHTKDEPRSKPHLDPGNDKTAHEDEQKSNDKTSHEDGQKLDGSESTEVSGRELQKVSTEDADKTKSSLWQNLKSLANEILEMWKKI